jgi:hypothetical protein
VKDLKSELGGSFEKVILAMMMTPAEYDARELKRAMEVRYDDFIFINFFENERHYLLLCTKRNVGSTFY